MGSVPSTAGGPYGVREIRSLYPVVTDNHLRYLEKWGLVRKSNRPRDRREYSFADLTTIKQVANELERGTPLRGVLRSILAERPGARARDFPGARHAARSPRRTAGAARAEFPRSARRHEHAACEGRQPGRSQADHQCHDATTVIRSGEAIRRRPT